MTADQAAQIITLLQQVHADMIYSMSAVVGVLLSLHFISFRK